MGKRIKDLSNDILITFFRRFFSSSHSIAKTSTYSVSAHTWANSFSNITYNVLSCCPHGAIICSYNNITNSTTQIEMYNTSSSSKSVHEYSAFGIGY